MFVFGGGALRTFSLDSSGQLDIFGHDGDSPGMDGTQNRPTGLQDKPALPPEDTVLLLTGIADLS